MELNSICIIKNLNNNQLKSKIMSRKRTNLAKQISSASINVRVEIKSKNVTVNHNITFITPNEPMAGKCYFTWIINNERSSK